MDIKSIEKRINGNKAVINEKYIVIYPANSDPSVGMFGVLVENVRASIYHGVIEISGKHLKKEFVSEKKKSNLERFRYPKKGKTIFGKEYEYAYGWMTTKREIPFRRIISGFILDFGYGSNGDVYG